MFLKTETLQYKNGPKKDGHKNTKTCFCNLPTCLLSSSKAVESSKGRGPGSKEEEEEEEEGEVKYLIKEAETNVHY